MASDPYLVLGVPASASDTEVRAAFRRLAQRHHPDHNAGSPESALRFAEVQEAYAHVTLLRRRRETTSAAGSGADGDPSLEQRLAAMERELRAAREQRERAARDAAAAAARTRRRHTAPEDDIRGRRGPDAERPDDEQLGYIRTEDSFSKILDDFADEVSHRFAEAREDVKAPQGRRSRPAPKSISDWIDELGSRLTGEDGKRER